MSTFKPIGWSNCHIVRLAKSKQKWKNQEEKIPLLEFHAQNSGRYWDRTSDPHNVNVVLYR